MHPIRAFVGHSFNELDEVVVRSFLNILDSINSLHPEFTWAHAIRPEPKDVSQKVLTLLEDKNLFIGICTKKECVVIPGALKPSMFNKNRYSVAKDDVQWKTSDWVIQEIGLSIGLGLEIILLIENGVRLPGALQGNLEYINFDREAPEKVVSALILMLSSLSPLAAAATSEDKVQKSASQGETGLEEQSFEKDFFKPAPDWTQDRYESALLRSVFLNQPDESAAIDNAYREGRLAENNENLICWGAFLESSKLRYGKDGNFIRLKKIAEDNPQLAKVHGYLGGVYESLQEFDAAAMSFEHAASIDSDISGKLKYLSRAAKAKAASGQFVSAKELINQMSIIGGASATNEEMLLKVTYEVASKEKDDQVAVAALERLLEINPADFELRFSLAYKYSEMDSNGPSLLHYSRIPTSERNGTTWNNLGVAFEQLGMPARSVGAYREAESTGESLAMSNLANIQISAGFLGEAKVTCENALKTSNPHRNVSISYSKLMEVPSDEENKESSILKKAADISKFYRDAGQAMVQSQNAFPLEWTGPDCILKFDIVGDQFKATGTYRRKESTLSLLSDPAFNKSGSNEKTYQVEYVGKIIGHAFVGTVERGALGALGAEAKIKTLLGAFAAPLPKIMMWVDPGCSEIKVLEREPNDEFKTYSLLVI